MSVADPRRLKNVIVLGAGVVGLTTALKIREQGGYKVTIIAEILPTDPKSIKYTSQWAAAVHTSFASDDPEQLEIDKETFEVLWKMSAPGEPTEGCFLRTQHSEYYDTPAEDGPHFLNWMPDFRPLEESELVKNSVSGVSFTTVTIDTPVYLNYLLSRFLASGGSIIRGSVQHIAQVVEGGVKTFSGGKPFNDGDGNGNEAGNLPDVIVNCTGIGARFLGGVEDKDVYPLKGQTVLLRAPWVRFGQVREERDVLTYSLPRRSGDVVVGGTKIADDWYPNPRPEITRSILTRVLEICPELVPPEIRAQRVPTVEDLYSIIIEEGCGLRPARKGGIRFEVEWFSGGGEASGSKVPVVHNYGHGGYGYQSSWGSAAKALRLLEKALANPQ